MTAPFQPRDGKEYKDWAMRAPYAKTGLARRHEKQPAMPNDPTPPEACHSMPELRTAIDRLDKQLVAMLARRQAYIERAAVLKSDRGTVRDTPRVEEVVRNVVAEANRAGLSPEIAEAVWRTLIEASIAHEYKAFDAKPD